ncbi:MAG: MOSC domain-containing protein [Gemmatimonadetes bacterium]|nr:MOSC domain-containing protein [Gemmatimonadota bacterium]
MSSTCALPTRTSPRVTSVRVGRPRWLGDPDARDRLRRPFRTAFVKEAVEGEVTVGPLGLEGDSQSDRRHHGGPEMAILAYSADHYPAWRQELGLPEMGPGGFGENLTIAGVDETSVCIGDTYAVGGARLQVSQPRAPCYNISRRWGRQDLMLRVVQTGRTGWYLRVLAAGPVAAGDLLRLEERPLPGWSVARVARVAGVTRDGEPSGLTDLARERALLAASPLLSPTWRERLGRSAAG